MCKCKRSLITQLMHTRSQFEPPDWKIQMSKSMAGRAKPKKRYFLRLRRWTGFDHYLVKLRHWWKQKLRKTIGKTLGFEANDLRESVDMIAYNMLYEVTDMIENKRQLLIPRIASVEATLEELLNTERSLARFGDGEIKMMFSDFQIGFQQRDELLVERLKEVLVSQEPGLMIGLINVFGMLGTHNGQWRAWAGIFRDHINPFLDAKKLYYDTGVTRVQSSREHFQKLKKIWEGKKVVTIEGNMCRLEVGNDLFNNVWVLQRILAPAECAFSAYDRILEEALKLEKDTLFLLALGPTATVLAYDLCKAGYRALDIGHLDICYELFLRGESRMVAIKGKYVNEASYRSPSQCSELLVSNHR